ncbi:hypothetical protein L7F22_058808 [Adiantum nelumboides]|nr:hypothetical protein [Adiantum nelumboides]
MGLIEQSTQSMLQILLARAAQEEAPVKELEQVVQAQINSEDEEEEDKEDENEDEEEGDDDDDEDGFPGMKWECISMDFVIGLPTIAGYNFVYVVVDMLTKVAHLMPVSMDFVTGLPPVAGYDFVYVVVDMLTKVAQLMLVKTTYTASDISRVFIKEILRLYGLPKRIVSDRDAKFTSKIWTSLFQAIGTQLCFSTSYHPQTDGQTERVNQVIEDILRAYCLQESRKWVQHLPLVEHAYNSFDHRSIGMSPFKALYGQEYIAPLNFSDPTIKVEASKQMLDEMKAQTRAIRKDIQAAQDRQKHYANKDRSERTFKLGDKVFLRVKPKQSNLSLRKFKKLSPRYCGPYEIVKVISVIKPTSCDYPQTLRFTMYFM